MGADAQFAVEVVYGTSQKVESLFPGEFLLDRTEAVAFELSGLSTIIDRVREQGLGKIPQAIPIGVSQWPDVQVLLNSISGLNYWVDRGYFEWSFGSSDWGMSVRVDSEAFRRFVERVSTAQPKNFEELEPLLP